MLASIRPRVSPLVFCLALTLGHALWAEETESGADVAELLRKARAGEVEAQLEVTEHFLMNATADTDDSPARDFKQVEQWLHAAALKGSAPAARLLGELLYHDYPGVPVNRVRAMAAFQKAAQGGDVRAMLMLAGVLTSGAEGVQADLAKAEAWINKAAAAAPEGSPECDQANRMRQQLADWREAAADSEELAKQAVSTDPEVRFQLGQRLLTEAGSDKDQQAAAVAHLRFAAEAGHAAAQDAYGTVLERSDRAAGFAWRLKAAEAGLASAQGYAALVLLRGSGPIPADPARGLDLAVRAQLQGDQLLPKTLNGSGYFPGLSSSEAQNLAFSPAPADRTRLLEAAARGEPEAQRWLARGPKPETGAVTRWLAAAAKQEHPGAQFSLGLAYFNGNEVPRNRTQATAWRSRAALLGYPEAQMSLAQNLLEGSGVPANPALARYWFEQVAASPAFIEGHRQIAREKAAAITVAALPPAAALEQTKNLALTARLPDPTEMVAATASQAAPTRPPAELRAAADQGDAAAMYALGRADVDRRQDESNRGSGVVTPDPQRDANDFRWIMAAARAGHPEAQFLAATHWLSAETDAAKKAWLEKAATQGHAAAKQRLDADTKAAAIAATQAAEAAKKAVADRELAANGDADAALRLFRARVKEIATTIVADFVAEQKGQPTSGKNYKQGYLDADMIKWGDLLTQRLHPDGLVLLHDYLRDDRPDFAYRALLLRERIAKIDLRLQLPDTGGGANSRAGFEKALAHLRAKLPAQQRAETERRAEQQLVSPNAANVLGANFELGTAGYPKDENLALFHYQRAAQAGLAEGQTNLGRCYQAGIGVAKDPVQARVWYAKAAAQGNARAQAQLKDLDTFTPMNRIKGLSAAERAKLTEEEWVAAEALALNGELREKLFADDLPTTLVVAVSYLRGANVFVQDYGRAFHWFSRAAQKGSTDAEVQLGFMHAGGLGRPVDVTTAFSHFLRAAERGNAIGQYHTARCYRFGLGVAADRAVAREWYAKSAAQGYEGAQQMMAILGNQQSRADEWDLQHLNPAILQRALAGDPDAQTDIGEGCIDGKDVPQNYERAFYWLSRAADQGLASALHNLGVMFTQGYGRPVDEGVAYGYFLKAAEKGNADSQYLVGVCLWHGKGVATDPLAAHDWLKRAADQNHAGAKTALAKIQTDAGLQLLLAQRNEGQALQQAQQGVIAAVGKQATPAWDPIKDNPILQQAALATKALQGDQAAAAALKAQQQQEKAQRDLINGTTPASSLTSGDLERLFIEATYAFVNGKTMDGKKSNGIELWEKAFALGHVYSAVRLSDIYFKGEGMIKRDIAKGRQWLEKAAATGDAGALADLKALQEEYAAPGSWELALGNEASDDDRFEDSRKFWEQAAALGQTQAMIYLGHLNLALPMFADEDVMPDLPQARAWYGKAAAAGSVRGMIHYGELLRDSVGGSTELGQARQWFERALKAATDADDRQRAQRALESLEGKTLESAEILGASAYRAKDYAKAADWWQKASALGSAVASFNLGVLHERGEGHDSDLNEAMRWFAKAQEQGHRKAEQAMAALTAKARPVTAPGERITGNPYEDAAQANRQRAREAEQAKTAVPAPVCDGLVQDLPAGPFAALQRIKKRNPGALTEVDAKELKQAILGDGGQIDDAERDLLAEMTQSQFRNITVRSVGAETNAPVIVLFPVSGNAKKVLRELLHGKPDFEAAWNHGAAGYGTICRYYQQSPEAEAEVLRFVADKFAKEWEQSNMANGYKPLRDLIGKVYGYSNSQGGDTNTGRTILYRSLDQIDRNSGDQIPDFLYNWTRPGGYAR